MPRHSLQTCVNLVFLAAAAFLYADYFDRCHTTTAIHIVTLSGAKEDRSGAKKYLSGAAAMLSESEPPLARLPPDLSRCLGAPAWARGAVSAELAPWRASGYTTEMFRKALGYGPCGRDHEAIEVRGGKLVKGQQHPWGKYVERAIQHWPFDGGELRDFQAVAEIGDWPCMLAGDPQAAPDVAGPAFTNSNNGKFHSVLMPVQARPEFDENFPKKRKKSLDIGAKIPWRDRKDVAVWRGSIGCAIGCGKRGAAYFPNNHVAKCYDDSRRSNRNPDQIGFTYGCGDHADERRGMWMHHWRVALVNYSAAHKECGIDVAFSTLGSHKRYIESFVPDIKPWMGGVFSDDVTAKHKYVFNVGNNGYADRSWRMFTLGSVVLLVDNGWREWYYSLLTPFEHYIPVKEDASDVCDKLQWARANPEKAEAIAQAGRRFAEDCMNVGLVDLYVAEMMRQLGALMRRSR